VIRHVSARHPQAPDSWSLAGSPLPFPQHRGADLPICGDLKPMARMIECRTLRDGKSGFFLGLNYRKSAPANLGRMKMPNAIGEVPTSIVATTVLLAVAITDTVWSNWFAT
jgi:hypothetical protein